MSAPRARAGSSELPDFVRDLEHDWQITVGATLNGGSEALVAHATTADGGAAIVKIGVPGPTGFEQEVRTLLLADGRGYVKLLRHDAERRVMLQERLGPQLAQLNWPIRDQMRGDLHDDATAPGSRCLDDLPAAERFREGALPGRTDRHRVAGTRTALQRARGRVRTRLRRCRATRVRRRPTPCWCMPMRTARTRC